MECGRSVQINHQVLNPVPVLADQTEEELPDSSRWVSGLFLFDLIDFDPE